MDNDLKNPVDLAVVGAGAAGSAERDGAGCGARCEPDPSYGIQTWQKQRLCDRYFARARSDGSGRRAGPDRSTTPRRGRWRDRPETELVDFDPAVTLPERRQRANAPSPIPVDHS